MKIGFASAFFTPSFRGTHVGGNTPIDLAITAYLSVDKNIVTVACYDDTRVRRQPGGIGLQLPDHNGDRSKAWSYGRATHSLEEFYERYKVLTDALLDNPRMLGFCYTQLTDVEQEQNGLFTYEGRCPKFDLDVLYAINSRRAAIESED